ncbi:MAG: phosphatase PAP2 family protein [Patescibacteria group bacterium]
MNFDFSLFKIIHSLVGKSIYLDSLGIFFAQYLIWLIPILIFLIWLFERKKLLKALFFGFLSAFLVYLFDFLFKKIYFRPRPFVSLNFQSLINISPKESSFPSTHTALAFCFAFSVYFINRRLGIILLILAFLIGLARIFTGVHWPSDILIGIVLAFFSSLIVNKIFTHKLN